MIRAGDAHEARTPAERYDVGGRVGSASRHELGCVVLKNENRSLARDASNLAVDELIGDEVADHEHAAGSKTVHER